MTYYKFEVVRQKRMLVDDAQIFTQAVKIKLADGVVACAYCSTPRHVPTDACANCGAHAVKAKGWGL